MRFYLYYVLIDGTVFTVPFTSLKGLIKSDREVLKLYMFNISSRCVLDCYTGEVFSKRQFKKVYSRLKNEDDTWYRLYMKGIK